MTVQKDHWGTAADGRTALRSIVKARLPEVSVVKRAANPGAVMEVRRETRSDGVVEYRSYPLAFRLGEGYEKCPDCEGTGRQDDDPNTACTTCRGFGWVPVGGDDEDDAEGRRDFSDKEKEQHGKAGQAIWIDGHWAYPTPTRQDYDNAVRALGRTPGKNRAKVRRYLMKRARGEGWPIPDSWQSDGTLKRSASVVLDAATVRSIRAVIALVQDADDAVDQALPVLQQLVGDGAEDGDGEPVSTATQLGHVGRSDRRTDWTLPVDQQRKPVHLFQAGMMHLAHSGRHLGRLGHADVHADPQAIKDHQDHAAHHHAKAVEKFTEASQALGAVLPAWNAELAKLSANDGDDLREELELAATRAAG